MASTTDRSRTEAYGQGYRLTRVDRFGVWLSSRRIRRVVGSFRGRRVADIGCGYHANFASSLLDEVDRLLLLDVALAPALGAHPKVTAIEGVLPDALSAIEDETLDVVICNSVLEHLWQPLVALQAFWRMTVPGGVVLLNVPSWRGKRFLETAAFRYGLGVEEMQDHKMYYDPRDLWPLLVRAGFRPKDIQCFRHKFGLNTFAICRKTVSSLEHG